MSSARITSTTSPTVLSTAQVWTFGGPPAQGKTVQFVSSEQGWAALGDILYSTADGGHSFHMVDDGGADVTSIDFLDTNDGWGVTGGGGLIRTQDGGQSWRQYPKPPMGRLIRAEFVDAIHGLVDTEAGELLSTDDGGANWTPVATPSAVADFCVEPGGPTWLSGDDADVYERTLPTAAWVKRLDYHEVPDELGVPESVPVSVVAPVRLACSGATIWAQFMEGEGAGSSASVLENSTDAGSTWQAVTGPITDEPHTLVDLQGIGLSSPTAGWYLSSSDAIPNAVVSVTDNSGGSFHSQTLYNADSDTTAWNNTFLGGTFLDASNGWVIDGMQTGRSQGVLVVEGTTDGGATWETVDRQPIS